MGTPVLTVCWSSPQLTSLSCDVEHPDMNNVKTTAIISLALLTVVTANREGGFVVRKKIKIPKNRDDSPGDSPREGRHLGLFTPLADLFLRLQCSPQQCLTNPTTARICCSRNFNLNCCFYNPGPPLYSSPAVTTPALWTPQAPFSLGLSVQLSQSEPSLEEIPHYIPPVDNHHQHQPLHGHHDHHKPGECPLPDTDYYNGPNYYHDTIPLVPGLGQSSLSYRSCSYDHDCRGDMKCCHLKVGHHKIVMHCRYPINRLHY